MTEMTEEQVLAVALESDLTRRERLDIATDAMTLASPQEGFRLTLQPVSREELINFVRAIAEGDPLFSSELVHGQRAIELAAWDLYRRLQEAHEL